MIPSTGSLGGGYQISSIDIHSCVRNDLSDGLTNDKHAKRTEIHTEDPSTRSIVFPDTPFPDFLTFLMGETLQHFYESCQVIAIVVSSQSDVYQRELPRFPSSHSRK